MGDGYSNILLLPKKNRFGSFYLFDKESGNSLDLFCGKYSEIMKNIKFGACFFNNISGIAMNFH